MIRVLSLFGLLIFIFGCKQPPQQQAAPGKKEKVITTAVYSKAVADSFSIFINLPNDYNPGQPEKYPVVYLLDANLYFDIIATTIDKYAQVGLAPNVILVGIGYRDFPTMDSLRNRDDTYPLAIPEYEMSTSGRADKFLSFINHELIPQIDAQYKTDTSRRILMGHSLGGYFTMYALLQDLLGQSNQLSGYIAASPSMHYNRYYLLNELRKVPAQKEDRRKIKAYVAYGGLEDDDNSADSSMLRLASLNAQLSGLFKGGYISYKSEIYSNLGHMDTQFPTFIKGLQWMLPGEE